MTRIGDRLRTLRGEAPLQEVADAVGVNTTVISRYERGKRIPVAGIMKKLAEYYKVSYEELRFLSYEDIFSDPEQWDLLLEWSKQKIFTVEELHLFEKLKEKPPVERTALIKRFIKELE